MFKRSRLVAAALFLALPSLARADTVEVVPNAPLPGLVLHVGDPVAVFLPPLPGAPGVAGAGATTITLPDLPFLAGFTILHQVFSEDPAAPSGWASSNGLALTYGL